MARTKRRRLVGEFERSTICQMYELQRFLISQQLAPALDAPPEAFFASALPLFPIRQTKLPLRPVVGQDVSAPMKESESSAPTDKEMVAGDAIVAATPVEGAKESKEDAEPASASDTKSKTTEGGAVPPQQAENEPSGSTKGQAEQTAVQPQNTSTEDQARLEDPAASSGQVKKPWLPEEDALLAALQREHGSAWAKIAESLPGRHRKAVRKRWVRIVGPATGAISKEPRGSHKGQAPPGMQQPSDDDLESEDDDEDSADIAADERAWGGLDSAKEAPPGVESNVQGQGGLAVVGGSLNNPADSTQAAGKALEALENKGKDQIANAAVTSTEEATPVSSQQQHVQQLATKLRLQEGGEATAGSEVLQQQDPKQAEAEGSRQLLALMRSMQQRQKQETAAQMLQQQQALTEAQKAQRLAVEEQQEKLIQEQAEVRPKQAESSAAKALDQLLKQKEEFSGKQQQAPKPADTPLAQRLRALLPPPGSAAPAQGVPPTPPAVTAEILQEALQSYLQAHRQDLGGSSTSPKDVLRQAVSDMQQGPGSPAFQLVQQALLHVLYSANSSSASGQSSDGLQQALQGMLGRSPPMTGPAGTQGSLPVGEQQQDVDHLDTASVDKS